MRALVSRSLSAPIPKNVQHPCSNPKYYTAPVLWCPRPCLPALDMSPARLRVSATCPGPRAGVAQVRRHLGGGARAGRIRVDLKPLIEYVCGFSLE